MKKTIKFIGIIVLTAMIGFSMTACDGGGGDSPPPSSLPPPLPGGDGSITINDWKFKVFDDSADGGSSTISMSSTDNILNVTGNLTKDCDDIFGNQNVYGQGQLTITPPTAVLQTIKLLTGFYFTMIGDGRNYSLQVETSDVQDYDYYQTTINTAPSGTEKTINVLFSNLTQSGWGAPVSFNKNNITGFRIMAHTDFGVGNFNYSILLD